ncbi:MAG: AMP-binding protein [Planctomycetes bacterium]|nr:AMP-binding protein [Planctomycetota bacterium]
MNAANEETLPPDLLRKIAQARDMQARPHARRFTNPDTFAAAFYGQSQARPDQTFMIYYGEDGKKQELRREHTYGAFYTEVRRIAWVLGTRLGLRRGERIVTAMHNHDRTIQIAFAAWHLGLTVVPLNMGEDDKRLRYVLEHSHARALVALDDYAPRMAKLSAGIAALEHRYTVFADVDGFDRAGFKRLEDELAAAKISAADLGTKPEEPRGDDEALIVYTSGTTGAPKGVVLTQYNLLADAHSITDWHDLTPGKRMMCVLPIHHVNGLIVTHVTPAFYGGSVVLNRKFSTSQFFSRIAQEQVHVVSVVPTLLQFLWEGAREGFRREKVPTLSHIICGAGPLTVDLGTRFEDAFDVPVCHGYGLSETTCYSCFLPIPSRTKPETHRGWMRDHGYPSIGIPVATNDMEIQDDAGQALPAGQKGEIVIRGHNVTTGYANNRAANENAFTHGWFRSGDEGFWMPGADGRPHFFISGRFKELIIRGGVKISPLEVDEVINTVPGLKAGMAVGFENTVFGEEVGCYAVKLPGSNVSAEDVLQHCRTKLAPHAAPKVVVFGETFPVTSTGKYQRNQLKPLFAAWKEAQFK